MTTDCTPRYCYADPYEGGKQAVAETYRNICAVGAKPLAITNCLNFANPQRPEIMAQIVGCLEGMADACRALDYPIVSGNVSLYNESKATGGGSAILPTPAIGGVGVLEDVSKMATIGFKNEGDAIWIVGRDRFLEPEIGQSLWLREIHGQEAGAPPKVDLQRCRKTAEFVRAAIDAGAVNAVHDVSDGGIMVAITEMALAGNLGANLHNVESIGDWSDRDQIDAETQRVIQCIFAETQDLYIVTTPAPADALIAMAEAAEIPFFHIGNVYGDYIDFEYFDDNLSIPLTDLRAAHESFFKNWMET